MHALLASLTEAVSPHGLRGFEVKSRGRVLCLVALTVAATSAPSAASRPALQNVVLITVDTLRQDHLSCYGYVRTTSPEIDALAREGVLFERVVAPMATTLPSHLSLMTGGYPARHGVRSNLRPGETGDGQGLVPLAEVLAERGYETAAFVAATPLKRHSGMARGFAYFDEPEGNQQRAAEITNRVLAWLRRGPKRPFFLWVHYFDPHARYDPPPPFGNAFQTDPALLQRLKERGAKVSVGALSHPPLAEPLLELVQLAELVDRYDGEILYADTEIGRLLDALRGQALWDETLVILTSDHGEGLGQHGRIQHGRIYQEQLRVPLVLKPAAGYRGARRVATVASLIDVVPTLAGLLGLPERAWPAGQLEGIDLLAPASKRRWVFSERTSRETEEWEPGRKYALIGERWKYLHSTASGDELYDLIADPFELHNVIDAHPRISQQMATALSVYIAGSVSESVPNGDVPEDTLQGLRNLGYVE